jgi:predicted acylesterase/phospholipase RssA
MTRILSIDGGGTRGILPAAVLAEIERRTGEPIAHLFDLVAGTSTGGIIALGLTIPKCAGAPLYSAQRFVELYEREGARIFPRSLARTLLTMDSLAWKKYSVRGIEEVLAEYFGEARLRDAVTDVLVTSYEIERRFPFFFKSRNARARPDYDFRARDVARATSAAPTYFEPMKISSGTNSDYYTLIDGGVFANNPAACALVEARTAFEDSGYLVVSLGTGSLLRSVPANPARHWGAAGWAKPVLEIVFDGVSSTVDYQLGKLLPGVAGESPLYYRFQTALDGHEHSIDGTSTAYISALKGLAAKLIEDESDKLDELCEALTRPAAKGVKCKRGR